MRQLTIHVPEGQAGRVEEIADKAGAMDIFRSQAMLGDHRFDRVSLAIDNGCVERLIDELEPIEGVRIHFLPRGVIALRPPPDEAPEQIIDVQPLSPIEVFLAGLQSIGSWTAFIGYSAAAGIVVWIALFSEVVFLLVAAMLIAPFAGPAMTAALATARGDRLLFRRSIGRYVAALSVAILVSFLLSVIMQQEIATNLMVDQSLIASVAVLLPLVSGAAGALNLCQSSNNSLVSGAATGMLIAASLAPPAGLVGMGAAIGEWDMVKSAGFLLMLQIAAINTSGAVVFRLYGIRPKGARFSRGEARYGILMWIGSLAALAALIAWQFSSSPDLQRSTVQQHALQDARNAAESIPGVQIVSMNARFTRSEVPGADSILITGFALSERPDRDQLEAEINTEIRRSIASRYDTRPLSDVTLLAP